MGSARPCRGSSEALGEGLTLMRRLLVTVLLVAYVLAEAALVFWLASQIGWLWVIAILAVQFAIGISISRRAGATALRGLGEASRSGALPGGDVGNSALRTLGGLLIALPGILNDIPGVLLLVPITRRWVRAATGATVGRRIQTAGFSTTTTTTPEGVTVTRLHEGKVISGEVIERSDHTPPPTATPGEVD